MGDVALQLAYYRRCDVDVDVADADDDDDDDDHDDDDHAGLAMNVG